MFTTDVYAMAIYGAIGPQPCINVLHYRALGQTGNLTPNVIANNFISGWSTTYQGDFLACLPEDYLLQGYKTKRVNNGGGPSIVTPVVFGTAGGRTGNVDASAVGPCLIAAYNAGTRWRAGRIFLPGVSNEDITENKFINGLPAVIDAFNADLLTDMVSTQTFRFTIWSPTHNGSFDPVTITTSGKPGLQNNRMKPTF